MSATRLPRLVFSPSISDSEGDVTDPNLIAHPEKKDIHEDPILAAYKDCSFEKQSSNLKSSLAEELHQDRLAAILETLEEEKKSDWILEDKVAQFNLTELLSTSNKFR